MDELLNKYADLILKRCINFKRSKSLLIDYYTYNKDFALLLKSKAENLSITDIYMHEVNPYDLHDYLKNTKLEDITLQKEFDRTKWSVYANKDASFIHLRSEIPGLMDDIDSRKLTKVTLLEKETGIGYKEKSSSYKIPWTIVALPNLPWAKRLFPNDKDAYNKLFMYIMKMCMIDRGNPIKAWNNFLKENTKIKNKLNELEIRELHYSNSLGTNFIVNLPKDVIWLNADKTDFYGNPIMPNLPSYEIFTTPDYKTANGIVYASKPLIYNGQRIENFYLEFKDGAVINFNAEIGYDAMHEILNSDPRAKFLGEVALVEKNSPISNTGIVFEDILFDENSSCHLALGDGKALNIKGGANMSEEELDESGINSSKIHVDFMIGTSDLNIEADTKYGTVLIFKNGNFNI